LGLGSVRPEDWLVVVGPRVGIFDFEKQAVIKWLDLPCLGLRCCRCSYRLGPFAFVAWSGGHPGSGVLGFEIDDGAVVSVEDPADSGWRGARCGGFGQGDRLPEAKAFELATNLVGIPEGFVGTHFAAAAGALEGIAAPDGEDALAPVATVSEGRREALERGWLRLET